MTQEQFSTFTQRLERLERENMWWRRSAVVSLAGVLCLLLMAQTSLGSRPSEVDKLVIRDPSGQAVLTSRGVVFADATGQTPRLSLLVATGDAGRLLDSLAFFHEGKTRLSLSLLPDGIPVIQLFDERGTTRIAFGLAHGGEPAIRLHDQFGKKRAVLTDSAAVLSFANGNAAAGVAMDDAAGTARIMIGNGGGNLVWAAP